MKQSQGYVILYACILTLVCGSLLALAAEGLKKRQNVNIALEKKASILNTAMDLKESDDVNTIYDERVKSYVIDHDGNLMEGKKADEVEIEKEYKKEPKDRLYPVYEVLDEQKKDILSYVLPVYGYGLWDNIWGYVAIQGDGNTVNGVIFDHEAETPGLGARITDAEIQKRYEGKHIYKGKEILGIAMQKGEQGGGDKSIAFYADDPHKVDGMSGATITGNGLTKMLQEYLSAYKNFLDDKRG